MKAQTIVSGTRIVKVLNCLCPDGRRRVANITGYGDTWFSIPARVQVKGLSVSGFITSTGHGEDIQFIPYKYRKNHEAFQCTENTCFI